MNAPQTSFWWNRADEPTSLQAVIFSIDALLADPRADEHVITEAVWDLHCAGIRVAVVTTGRWAEVRRAVRDIFGDGAVEVLVTGDEVSRPKPDPEVYLNALWQMGIRAADALAVEDCAAGLHAALAAGLATMVVTTDRTNHQDFTGAAAVLDGHGASEQMSSQNCRQVWAGWQVGQRDTALTA